MSFRLDNAKQILGNMEEFFERYGKRERPTYRLEAVGPIRQYQPIHTDMSTNQLPQGADHELDFWRRFITTPQFATWLAPGKTPELDDSVAELIKDQLAANPSTQVLDVASGVVSILNGLVPHEQLTPIDVLALEYCAIFDHHAYGIPRPFPFAAEEIPDAYANNFDIVHIRNGLDHCQDVPKAFDAMVGACKPGGYVIVQGFEREGTAENWKGFHQCDLFLVDAHLCADHKGCVLNSDKRGFSDLTPLSFDEITAQVSTLPNGKTWFIWIGQKPASK